MIPRMTVESAIQLGAVMRDIAKRVKSFFTERSYPPHKYEDFNLALNFALDVADEGIDFLRVWREGGWSTLDREWPEWGEYVDRDIRRRTAIAAGLAGIR